MKPFVQLAINIILKWAYSLTRSDFDAALKFVMEAEKRFLESKDKREFVRSKLVSMLPDATGRALNFLLELAVAKLGTLQSK